MQRRVRAGLASKTHSDERRAMNTSEQLNELAKALSTAQGKFESVAATKNNPFFQSKYADLADIVKAAAPILQENGLAVTQLIGYDELGRDTLTTRVMHSSGQWIESTMQMYLNKKDAQNQGSASTYARRYSYSAIL